VRSNSKHTANELEKYIQLFLDEGISYRELYKEYGLSLGQATFGQKVLRYQTHGLKGIESKSKNNRYSQTFKLSVIKEHLFEGTPIKQLARKYDIPSPTTVRNWIIK
jgi:putative aminopeptidase FrvX